MNKELHRKYFFYIDSDNFEQTKDSQYGFMFTENNGKVSINDNDNFNNLLSGSYILVKHNGDAIDVITDDFSSLSVFYYKDTNFYAISNSFYDLVTNLKHKGKHITINKTFIKQYIQSPLHTHALYGTLINEIKLLPIFTDVKLTKTKFQFVDKNIDMHSVDIDSIEGNNIINNWIDKWATIIRSIYNANLPIQVDLSGGFDSRVIFSLFYYAIGGNLNTNNVNIFSRCGGSNGMIKHLGDDYDIATEIANRLNLTLNKNPKIFNNEFVKYPSDVQYDILKNCFMGFHKEGYLCTKQFKTPHIHFGGVNGEIIRGALPSLDTFRRSRFTRDPIHNDNEVIDLFFRDLDLLKDDSKTEFEALVKFFIATQCRSHFGMSIFNDYLSNTFLISPFNDKELLKLNVNSQYDKSLTFAIIINKTCPNIFDIDFAHRQKFSDDTKVAAIELCKKYPLTCTKNEIVFDIESINNNYKEYDFVNDNFDAEHELYRIFLDNKELFITHMSELFSKDYAEKIYEHANTFYLNKDNFYPNSWITCLTSIIEVFKILYE